MSTRDRVLTTFAHRQPDRTPSFTRIHPDALAPLAEHLGVDTWNDLEDALKIDHWRNVELNVIRPEDHVEQLMKFVPPEFLSSDSAVMCESDGRIMRASGDGDLTDAEVLWNPLQNLTTLEELAEYPYPDLMDLDTPEDFEKQVQNKARAGAIVTASVVQPFQLAARQRGFENLLCDFMIRPEIVNFLYDRAYRHIRRLGEEYAAAGVDVLHVSGDIAMDRRMYMAPDVWRRHEKKLLHKFVMSIREIKPNICIGFHSNGKFTDIIPDLVEIGFDFISPIEPECMDPTDIKDKWGSRMVLHGCISHQLLSNGSPQEVQEAVEQTIYICGKAGGLILGPTNEILPSTPVANVVAMYRAIR